MRASVFIFAVALIATAAQAATWRRISSNRTGSIGYIDQDSIRRGTGSLITAWFKFDHSADRTKTARETIQMNRIDCDNRTLGVTSIIEYGADGRVTGSETVPSYRVAMEPAAPDSVGELMVDAACPPRQ